MAVNNISIDIKKGEVICITGHNGSGKSTLLKMIAEVTQPTSGEIEIDGKVASILEIGIGFQPEISGYENIFLSGAMYGLKKSEIEAKIDSIIDMFGFPEFINTPVKYYSSGMYMRLAFSIIVNINADIYLFDEVTSVGDTDFRTKVIHEISRLKDRNATVLIVTHTPTIFSKISDRFLLFDKGTISVSKSLNNLQGIGNFDNQLHISCEKLAQIKEMHTENIDFDIIDLKMNTPVNDLNAIFDNDIEVVATICNKSYESTSILMTICDIMGNIITSASTELMASDTENNTITFVLPKGYLHPAPLSLGFEILNDNGKSVISYPNVINMPYMKKDSLSGYLNMPIKITKGI